MRRGVVLLAILAVHVFAAVHNQESPIFAAIEEGSLDQVQQLVNEGLPLRGVRGGARGGSVLHAAVDNAFLHRDGMRILVLLLAQDTDIDAVDAEGRSVLYLAVMNGNMSLVEAVLSRDPNMDATFQGDTALRVAQRVEDHRLVNLLMRRTSASHAQARAEPESPIFQAIRSGLLPLVQEIVASGTPLRNLRETEGGGTVLHVAVEVVRLYPDSMRILELLLLQDVDINAVDRLGRTVLYIAVMHGGIPAVRAVLARNPDMESTYRGDTVLHVALRSRNAPLADLLVNHGASLLTPTHTGLTLQQRATDMGDEWLEDWLHHAEELVVPHPRPRPAPVEYRLSRLARILPESEVVSGECPICMEKLDNPDLLPLAELHPRVPIGMPGELQSSSLDDSQQELSSRHIFHQSCLQSQRSSNLRNNCPICRRPFTLPDPTDLGLNR